MNPSHPYAEVTPREALARQAAGAVIVDVREDAERWLGMPRDAVGIPRAALPARAADELPDRDREVLTLCGVGQRSLVAAQMLREMGYARVVSVAGGFRRWQAEGLPVADGIGDTDTAERYARQMRLPQIGPDGQARLRQSSVALVGAGGLGSPVALYLAAAGVGHLTLIDDDRVERSNLHRQIVHADDRVGQPKVLSAQRTLQALNPSIEVRAREGRLDAGNAEDWLLGHDVVVDGADNFPTRYVLADACQALALPMVYAAIERFSGQASVFDPQRPASPCYRCLFPDPPAAADAPNCADAGVLGVLPGMLGTIQATEVLKLLLDIGEPLVGRLLQVDALTMRFHELRLRRDPDCPGCGPHPRPVATEPDCASL